MPERLPNHFRPRPVISITWDPDVLAWVDDQCRAARTSRSRFVEACLHALMKRWELDGEPDDDAFDPFAGPGR